MEKALEKAGDLTPPNLGTGQCITIIDTPGTKDTEGEHKVSRNYL